MKKALAILSAAVFLFSAALCPALSPSLAESPAPDVPVISYKGTDYVPVLFTMDYYYIREQFPWADFSPEMFCWLVRLRAVGGSAYEKPAEFPDMNLLLVSDGGLELRPTHSSSSDAVPPEDTVLFQGPEYFEGDHFFLVLDGRIYPLENVPDADGFRADLFTPEPTATPEPKSELQTALEERLQKFKDRGLSAGEEIPPLEGQVFVAVFNSSELLETSAEAAQAGTDFHGIPAARLAASYGEQDTLLLVYRGSRQVGYYSTGGIALRVFTNVAVIRGSSERKVCVAVNEPPERITATVGNGGAGEYEPETALRLIAERLAEAP